jgi:hypothetical protein
MAPDPFEGLLAETLCKFDSDNFPDNLNERFEPDEVNTKHGGKY